MRAYASLDAVENLDVDRDRFDKFHTRQLISRLLRELWRMDECVASVARLSDDAESAWQSSKEKENENENDVRRQSAKIVRVFRVVRARRLDVRPERLARSAGERRGDSGGARERNDARCR
jgi:hypothetical protein